jgi:hypothetical protein
MMLDKGIFFLNLSCVRGGSAVNHEWTHLNWLRGSTTKHPVRMFVITSSQGENANMHTIYKLAVLKHCRCKDARS